MSCAFKDVHFIIHFFRKEYLFCSNFLFRSALFKVPERLSMPKDILQECLLWSKHNPTWFPPAFSTTWHETCIVNPNSFPQKNLPNYVFHALPCFGFQEPKAIEIFGLQKTCKQRAADGGHLLLFPNFSQVKWGKKS